MELYLLGEVVLSGAVHAVPAVRRPLQPAPGARGRPARRFVLMAETKWNDKINY